MMKNYDPKTPLLSIHIPKCGGTSLKEILQKWYGDKLVFHYYNAKYSKMPKKHHLTKGDTGDYIENYCIHGHFNRIRGFGVDDYYPKIKQAITFLRDPLEISLSVFHFNNKKSKEGGFYKNGKKREFINDIDEYLENTKPYIRYHLPEKMSLENTDDFFNNYFVHIGVMEYYQESMDILADKLGKPKIQIGHKNISKRLSNPSKSSIEKFKSKCSYEYLLYNKALKVNDII